MEAAKFMTGSTDSAKNDRTGNGIPANNGSKTVRRTPTTKAVSRSRGPCSNANEPAGNVAKDEFQMWERVRARLRTQLGSEVFNSWFGRLKLEDVSTGIISHSVPTAFLKSWINSHYADTLLKLWQDEKPDILRVGIVLRSAIRVQAPVATAEKSTSRSGTSLSGTAAPLAIGSSSAQTFSVGESVQGFSGSPLDPRYTFASFVEGPSNRMAYAAARSVAEAGRGALSFNPLFIHASVGLGKTHLLQSIAWSARRTVGGAKVLYLTAEYFMWRFATAIRDQSALSFKESLRDIDLLLIDDMQFLQGKSIQQEFCHLLNALIDSAKQVVVAADRPPAELESLDLRVRSRLQGGVALEIASPDLQMRRSMLEVRHQEALNEGVDLEIAPEILDYVARMVTTSGRDVEGAFNQLMVQHRFSEGPLNIENVEILLKHLVKSGEQKRVRIEDIQKVVSRHFNVSKNDLLSNRRTRVIVRPRQIAMYLAKVLTPRSLPEIGRRFGGRDHTTVLHAVRKVEKMSSDDVKLSHEIELLKRLIME